MKREKAIQRRLYDKIKLLDRRIRRTYWSMVKLPSTDPKRVEYNRRIQSLQKEISKLKVDWLKVSKKIWREEDRKLRALYRTKKSKSRKRRPSIGSLKKKISKLGKESTELKRLIEDRHRKIAFLSKKISRKRADASIVYMLGLLKRDIQAQKIRWLRVTKALWKAQDQLSKFRAKEKKRKKKAQDQLSKFREKEKRRKKRVQKAPKIPERPSFLPSKEVWNTSVAGMKSQVDAILPGIRRTENVETARFPAQYITSYGWITDKKSPAPKKKIKEIMYYYAYYTMRWGKRAGKQRPIVGYYMGQYKMRIVPKPHPLPLDMLMKAFRQLVGQKYSEVSETVDSVFSVNIYGPIGYYVISYA